MARKALGERFNRTLTKVAGGKSTGITLPKEYLEALDWQVGDEVHIELHRKQGLLVKLIKPAEE